MARHPAGGLRPCGCTHTERTHMDVAGPCAHPGCGCLRFHTLNQRAAKLTSIGDLIAEGFRSSNQATRLRAGHLEEYVRELADQVDAERRQRQVEAAADAQIADATDRLRSRSI